MYKTIKNLRGEQTQRTNLIKDGNENLLFEPNQVAARWREYFADLLDDVEKQDQPPTEYRSTNHRESERSCKTSEV
jgi:hypothetical protein